ncbi:unnamed protein product [Lota lota]
MPQKHASPCFSHSSTMPARYNTLRRTVNEKHSLTSAPGEHRRPPLWSGCRSGGAEAVPARAHGSAVAQKGQPGASKTCRGPRTSPSEARSRAAARGGSGPNLQSFAQKKPRQSNTPPLSSNLPHFSSTTSTHPFA